MPTSTPFPHLQGHRFMNLTTYRKTGVAVTTPVWFTQEGDKLYVYTGGESGKVKRIRNSGSVEVGPSNQSGKSLGETQPATARILGEDEGKHADQALNQKYGWQKQLIGFFNRMRAGKPAYLEITPATK